MLNSYHRSIFQHNKETPRAMICNIHRQLLNHISLVTYVKIINKCPTRELINANVLLCVTWFADCEVIVTFWYAVLNTLGYIHQ